MDWLLYAFVAVLAYLLGSIPTGFLVARARGVDIRSVGSGNIGATNVFRILGKGAGVFVLAADMLKGVLAVWLVPGLKLVPAGSAAALWLPLVAGLLAILGHTFTCWLRFKGGKGIATSAGVFLALATQALLVTMALWLVVFAVSRYVSLVSVAAAVCLPVAVWWFGGGGPLVAITTAISALAIYKHKANIQRLLQGTEHRIGARKPDSPS